jgi:hypothetical protein|nr:MAG TPA: hypothetical protein [Caudoviricetes sp.]
MKKNILVRVGDRLEAQNVEMTVEEIVTLEKECAEMPTPPKNDRETVADMAAALKLLGISGEEE